MDEPIAIGGLHFCGTIPRIAPAGRYPAPCPVELGLSSRTAFRPCTGDCPACFFELALPFSIAYEGPLSQVRIFSCGVKPT